MKCLFGIVFLFLLPLSQVFAQPYATGHRTMNFTDPDRNNRPVPTEVYYPSEYAGNNTPVADGIFPIVIFGHGYLMGYDSYSYLNDTLASLGYIMVYTKTEGGLFPDHEQYGADLAFLVSRMQSEGNDPVSPFYQHIDSTSAIMGHSMGGGASFLACENNALPTIMVTLAAAETNPSAILAATHVTIPSLVFAGEEDCVTPPAQHQIPMYDSLASSCKVFISINGGGHCYFADESFQCSLGEIGCQQNFTITRQQQQDAMLDFLKPYFDYFLKGNPGSWVLFMDSLAISGRITYQEQCIISGMTPGAIRSFIRVFPNPARDVVTIVSDDPVTEEFSVSVRSLTGITLLRVKSSNGSHSWQSVKLDVSRLVPGFYLIEISGQGINSMYKLLID